MKFLQCVVVDEHGAVHRDILTLLQRRILTSNQRDEPNARLFEW